MTERITHAELLRLRLCSQGLVASARVKTPVDVVRRLFAVQGQDLPGALWSIGLRTQEATRADVVEAFNSGKLVRMWPFRGTLHIMESANFEWVRDVTATRTIAAAAARRRDLDIDDDILDRARGVANEMLSGGHSASRKEFFAALAGATVDSSGQRGIHLLQHLCLDGTLLLGPIEAAEQKIVLADEWIPASSRRKPSDAMEELVLRYLAGHGPADEADIAWWMKLPLGMVRAGLESCAGELTQFIYGRQTLWAHLPTLDAVSDARPSSVLLLPGFDELLLGYRDRSASLASGHASLTVPGNNGMFRPTVVSRGRVVGLWSRKTSASTTTVNAAPFDCGFSQTVTAGLTRKVRRYGRFVQMPSEVTVVA